MWKIQLDTEGAFLPPITKEAEVALFTRYYSLGPCPERDRIRERIIRHHLRFAAKLSIQQHYKTGMPVDDLYGEAKLSLLEAFDAFDFSKGVKFISYAVWHVRKAFTNVHKKERVIQHNLAKEGGEKIEKRWGEHSNPLSFRFVSLEQPVSNMEDATLADTLSDDSLCPVDDTLQESEESDILLKAMASLPPREEKILRMYYGIGGGEPYTMRELGDTFGISKERCRQILEKAALSLRKVVQENTQHQEF